MIVALQACGRSDVGDYYFDDDLPNAGNVGLGGATGTAGNSAKGGKNPGKGGTSSMTAGTSAVGGTVSVGGNGATGGAAVAGTSQGGFAQAGVGGTGAVIPVTCGGEVCNAASETCCATLGGFGCISSAQECTGAVLNCGSSSDCGGGGVCCLQIIGEVNATADCKSECEGMGPGRERRLCTEDSECSANRPFCRDTTFGVRVCTRF